MAFDDSDHGDDDNGNTLVGNEGEPGWRSHTSEDDNDGGAPAAFTQNSMNYYGTSQGNSNNNINVDPGARSEIDKIQNILWEHDTNGRISECVYNHLVEDRLTLEKLSNFNDKYLEQTVESWKNIDQLHPKPFLVRGVLIDGIKQMRSPHNSNYNSNYNSDDNDNNDRDMRGQGQAQGQAQGQEQESQQRSPQRSVLVVTQEEARKHDKLIKYENTIVNEIDHFENESKIRECMKDELFEEYRNEIESVFDEIIEKMDTRRDQLLKKLELMFDTKSKKHNKYLDNLKSILSDIKKCKNEYDKNLETNNNQDIQQRSETNCSLIDGVLSGRNHFYKLKQASNSNLNYQCNILFDNKIQDKIERYVFEFGSITHKPLESSSTISSRNGWDDEKENDELSNVVSNSRARSDTRSSAQGRSSMDDSPYNSMSDFDNNNKNSGKNSKNNKNNKSKNSKYKHRNKNESQSMKFSSTTYIKPLNTSNSSKNNKKDTSNKPLSARRGPSHHHPGQPRRHQTISSFDIDPIDEINVDYNSAPGRGRNISTIARAIDSDNDRKNKNKNKNKQKNKSKSNQNSPNDHNNNHDSEINTDFSDDEGDGNSAQTGRHVARAQSSPDVEYELKRSNTTRFNMDFGSESNRNRDDSVAIGNGNGNNGNGNALARSATLKNDSSNSYDSSNNNRNNRNRRNRFDLKRSLTTRPDETVITTKVECAPNTALTYNHLQIISDGCLTVSKRGILRIRCVKLTLADTATIDVTGKGYQGAVAPSMDDIRHNISRDDFDDPEIIGPGGGNSAESGYGGGGGYATAGVDGGRGVSSDALYGALSAKSSSRKGGLGGLGGLGKGKNKHRYSAKGGKPYGDAQLSNGELLLGSGGGSGNIGSDGTNGGGAIIIECTESIFIGKSSGIIANGVNDKKSIWCGCGSGGSIHLKAPIIVNNGKIEAIGGVNMNGENVSGAGGYGRIRIDCEKSHKRYVCDGSGGILSFGGRKKHGNSSSSKPKRGNQSRTKIDRLIQSFKGTGSVTPKVGYWNFIQ